MDEHKNRKNNSFNHIIRRKLQNYPVHFDPAAWKEMKKKFDNTPDRGRGGAGR